MINPENPQEDIELNAIETIIHVLEKLDITARNRVLNYISNRLSISQYNLLLEGRSNIPYQKENNHNIIEKSLRGTIDIRTFAGEKKPTTMQERIALLAYYLSELAPENERKSEITSSDITKYFKQANFKYPTRNRQAFLDAKNAGYLDPGSKRGSFKINPVGYNLIAYGLPSKKEKSKT
jgi:hypothetical protein